MPTRLFRNKRMLFLLILLTGCQLIYSQNLTGPTPVDASTTHTYTFSDGVRHKSLFWLLDGGTKITSETLPGYVYTVDVQWGVAGTGSVNAIQGLISLGSLAVTIAGASGPAVPDLPALTYNCNSTRLTRGNPPGGETWYWQDTASGTSVLNAAQYADRPLGTTVYYLRSYKSTTASWSDARTVNYTVTQNGCALSNENYVHTIIPQIGVTDISGLTNNEKIESVTYYDGLGRSVQNIGIRAGGTSDDIITHIEYDEFGRQVRDYLPYTSAGNDGHFSTDALTDVQAFYTAKYAGTTNPYSEKHLEASPLSRLLEQGAPGSDWQVIKNSNTDHTIKFDYQTNTGNEVKKYAVTLILTNNTYIPTLVLNTSVNSGNYPANVLYKTIIKDENWKSSDVLNKTTEEFKDKLGRVVLKRTYNNGSHDTYYVYDDYGNLSYVLPPKSEPDGGLPNALELSELCYQYKYDLRNRLVEKKIPGKGDAGTWEEIVYNKLNQPILTRDPNLKTHSQWLFTKYDNFGRVAYTGIINSSSSRTTLQNNANGMNAQYVTKSASYSTIAGTTVYYSGDSNVAPNSGISEIHTINYYDNYTFDIVSGNSETSYSVTPITNAKGLATGSKVRVLGASPVKWITTVSYYDDKARPVYIYSFNDYLNTTDKVKSKFDFIGNVVETTATHEKTGNAAIVTVDRFTYDAMQRLLRQTQMINTQEEELIAENSYDELGQLIVKKVGHTANSATRLQTIDYSYNIRGWLKNINQDSSNDNDLFNFTLMYNDIADTTKKLYNGNISQTSWNTLSNNTTGNPVSTEYVYTYDHLNRITSAIGANTSNYNLDLVQYDKNGNITALNRKGHTNTGATSFGNMDLLNYEYEANSNKLKKVTDTSGKVQGFNDGSNQATDYYYDANGNMKEDINKGIIDIGYNHLNLPVAIELANGAAEILYVYDATGVKLQKTVDDDGVITITQYTGNGAVYENNTLQFIPHAEGYVTPNGSVYDYVYQYKDHLQNIRLSYSDADGNGTISQSEIIEENNYYPMGLKHRGYNNINGVEHKWKYNSKELQDELGLNWYDLGARNLDHALGRFMNIDPRAEDYNFQSPYAFANNNPIFFIDINGEGVDWDPEVDTKGNITYVAEAGDSAKSLSDQYGIKQSDAEKITGTTGSTKIEEGTKVTGEKVASVIKGNDNGILKLDTTDKSTTKGDIVKQAIFAVRNENVQESLGNAGADGEFGSGNIYDYFTTSKSSKVSGGGAYYGLDSGRQRTILKIGDYSFSLGVGIGEQSNGRFSTFVGGHRQSLQADGSYAEFIDFNYPKSKNKSSRGLKSLTSRVIGFRVYSGNTRVLRDHLDGK